MTHFIPALYVCLTIALVVAIVLAGHYRSLSRRAVAALALQRAEASQAQYVASNYLDACRLLRIDRNGRLNVFTFARGDQLFTVETMGLLEDNPDEWRTMAGLTR